VVAALALALILAALLYAGRPSAPVPPAPALPALTLSLSGTVTTDLRASPRDLARVRCTPSGFHVATFPDLAPFAFEVSFEGASRGTPTAYHLLGAGVGPLVLRVNTLGASGKGTSGSVFRSLEGSVTVQGDTRRFTAFMVDDHSRPLFVSGRLSCP